MADIKGTKRERKGTGSKSRRERRNESRGEDVAAYASLLFFWRKHT